jgi:hypothetical protein
MNKKLTLIGGAFAAATLLLPGIASASYVLDTGTPDGSGGPSTVLNSAQWVAAEFYATAGETITSLSAYLLGAGTNVPNVNTFSFDIYSGTNFNGRSTSRTLLQPVTATYEGDGWNTATLNWTVPTTGDYWLALQVGGTAQATNGLYLPTEPSTSTGTVPALGFAYLNSNTGGKFLTTGAPTFGVEVSAVPLPTGFWLLASGLLGLGAVMGLQHTRRKSQSAEDHSQAPAMSGIHAIA